MIPISLKHAHLMLMLWKCCVTLLTHITIHPSNVFKHITLDAIRVTLVHWRTSTTVQLIATRIYIASQCAESLQYSVLVLDGNMENNVYKIASMVHRTVEKCMILKWKCAKLSEEPSSISRLLSYKKLCYSEQNLLSLLYVSQFHTVFHSQFQKLDDICTQGVPYDYHSIMHYRSSSYPIIKEPTILSLIDSVNVSDLGSAPLPTEYDYLHINLLYCQGK